MLKDIRGVGDKLLEKLNSLGIFDEIDLINTIPKSYLDLGQIVALDSVVEGEYCLVKVTVTQIKPTRIVRKGLSMVQASAEQDGIKLTLTWFNTPYITSKLSLEEILVYGKLTKFNNRWSMSNPTIKPNLDKKELQSIIPIYALKDKIPQGTFNKIVREAINIVEPKSLISGINLTAAYHLAHYPTTQKSIYRSHFDLAINDLVADLIEYRKYRSSFVTISKVGKNAECDTFINTLPYELTDSQKVAISDISADMSSGNPMNRLLLGDVGSGKTVVAMAALYMNCKSGYQGVLLAPTEVLSNQHYLTLDKLMTPLGIRVAKLSGECSAKEAKLVKENLANGSIDIVIGTHSCISKGVDYKSLGLIIIDELHKFGVKQKADLLSKGQSVDCLVMSATPLPRTLAMVMYGDLSQSQLELRENQKTIKTFIMRDDKLDGLYNYIIKNSNAGHQSYIVCPRIEDADGIETMSSKQMFEQLSAGQLSKLRLALLHGKMTSQQKNEVMTSFSEGRVDVLIATSLIEVGIDIANASIIAIMAAEQFGLSTLHQLRGRVGRGNVLGECFLHIKSNEVPPRIKAMQQCNDGIKLAQLDARIRGLGDIIGVRQKGKSGYDRYKIRITPNMVAKAKVVADRADIEAKPSAITNPLGILLN